MMSESCNLPLASGYRGYVGSRPYVSGDFPQHVQNMIIRNYCQKYQMVYLLSATEYAIPECYMILDEVVQNVESVKGIAMFSLFMLPTSAKKRREIYDRVLKAGKTLHAALEDIAIKSEADIQMVEDILRLNEITLKDEVVAELVAV